MTAASAYWQAIEGGDERAALAVATSELDAGMPLDRVLNDLVVAAQLEVGRRWAAHEWTVADEHAATAIGEHVVTRLAAGLPPTSGPLRMVACVEREWHALPALVLHTSLRARGVNSEYLGASVTREHLISQVVEQGPRTVLLSASLSSSLPRVRRHIEAVRGTGTPVVVGGSAFDPEGAWARRLGATGSARSVDEALDLLPTLPRHVGEPRALTHPGADEARALQATAHVIARSAVDRVFAEVDGDTTSDGSPDHWATVLVGHTPHLVDALAAALLVEDRAVLTRERAWLSEVLRLRGAPDGTVERLWSALREQVHDHPEALAVLGQADA